MAMRSPENGCFWIESSSLLPRGSPFGANQHDLPGEPQVTINLSIRTPNRSWIKKPFRFPTSRLESCIIHGEGALYSIEATHSCLCRQMLLECIVEMLPLSFNIQIDAYWFQTLNSGDNATGTCLFDGAVLEMKSALGSRPEFGLCFKRDAFVTERNAFEALAQDGSSPPNLHEGDACAWIRREPSDTDRLRVNRKGWEVLYFVQPPSKVHDVTITEVLDDVCRTLGILERRRVAMSSGPFYWGPDFLEDGKGLYSTYFRSDLMVDSRHMKTVHGSALLYVMEIRPGGSSTNQSLRSS